MQTLSEIREMLEAAGLRPQKAFGQNFLIDHNLLAEVVNLSGCTADDAVLEIGPGTGALTDFLIERAARVLSVEIDHGLAALLRDRYSDCKNFQLVEADILATKHCINPVAAESAAQMAAGCGGRLKLIANLPYNIATSLICELVLLKRENELGDSTALATTSITATVQKEAAERLACDTSHPSQYGSPAIICSLFASVKAGKILPPEAFWPRPKVTSQIIHIEIATAPASAAAAIKDPRAFQALLAGCFAQRRKKIASANSRCPQKFDKARWTAALEKSEISPDLRPENITAEKFAALATALEL